MYIRPSSVDEAVKIIKQTVEETAVHKSESDEYSILWTGFDNLLKLGFFDDFVKKGTEKNELGQFVCKNMCPIIEEYLRNPKNIRICIRLSLEDMNYAQYNQDIYEIIQIWKHEARLNYDKEDMARVLWDVLEDVNCEQMLKIIYTCNATFRQFMRIARDALPRSLRHQELQSDKVVPIDMMFKSWF